MLFFIKTYFQKIRIYYPNDLSCTFIVFYEASDISNQSNGLNVGVVQVGAQSTTGMAVVVVSVVQVGAQDTVGRDAVVVGCLSLPWWCEYCWLSGLEGKAAVRVT